MLFRILAKDELENILSILNNNFKDTPSIEYIDEDENFCMTYGDGLSNVNITRHPYKI